MSAVPWVVTLVQPPLLTLSLVKDKPMTLVICNLKIGFEVSYLAKMLNRKSMFFFQTDFYAILYLNPF